MTESPAVLSAGNVTVLYGAVTGSDSRWILDGKIALRTDDEQTMRSTADSACDRRGVPGRVTESAPTGL